LAGLISRATRCPAETTGSRREACSRRSISSMPGPLPGPRRA